MNNYSRSYTNGATDFSQAKVPVSYLAGDLKQGEVSIEDYAEKKYFRNI